SKSKEGIFIVERRKHPRIRVELPLDYSLADREETCGGVVANASEGGLLVYLSETTELGTLLKIEILFVKGSELNTIRGIAKVVWSDLAAKKAWGEYRYGLQFQSFQEGDLKKLKTLLQEVGKTHDRQG
ncbi:MAG: PilZ domain-containing protein, partial [candidate division Zixibacteria bacterium]|nr:PilZ domain-containing protein [candidate division Zixibacteria bacterium]